MITLLGIGIYLVIGLAVAACIAVSDERAGASHDYALANLVFWPIVAVYACGEPFAVIMDWVAKRLVRLIWRDDE